MKNTNAKPKKEAKMRTVMTAVMLVCLVVSFALAGQWSWEPEVRLTDTLVYDRIERNQKSVVVDPTGRVHVVWWSARSDTIPSYEQIWYKRFNPGMGWTTDTCISHDIATTRANVSPSIACDSSGNIHVVWLSWFATPTQIRAKTCRPTGNGNAGWDSVSVVVVNFPGIGSGGIPDICCTPDNHIHVAWTQSPPTGDTFYRVRYVEKVGSSWQTPFTLDSVSNTYYYGSPSIAGGRNNNIHITWFGRNGSSPSYNQIWYRGRISGTWIPIENVSQTSQGQRDPSIACHPATNNPHIGWRGYNGAFYTRIIHSERTGGSWQTDTVSEYPSSYEQNYPEITFTPDGTGHVVWDGYTATSPSSFQIRYNARSPAGIWGTPVTLTNLSSNRYYPSIANGGNSSNPKYLHVVWYDQRDGNDEIYYIRGNPPPDVGCFRILAPVDTISYGATLTPQAMVRNYGGGSQTFDVKFDIGSYTDTRTVSNLAPGDSAMVSFAVWTANQPGVLATKCSTRLTTDNLPDNDRATGTVFVQVNDAQSIGIIAPTGQLDSGTVVAPQVKVRNNGNQPASFSVRLRIGTTYDQQGSVTALNPDEERTITGFPNWVAGEVGTFAVKCSTRLSNDMVPSNDLLTDSVRVVRVSGPSSGWREMKPMPAGSKAVKDGGWLTIDQNSGLIYAAKGNKTPECYTCSSGTAWKAFSSAWPNGRENKSPHKGAAACSDGAGCLYATKGNNTQGFWRYYHTPDSGAWTQLTDVPLGASNKKVRGGTDVVYVVEADTGYVYLLKGYRTDFFRYNTLTNAWQQMPNAPADVRLKWDKGSWLVYDGANAIYAHKAKYHELWRFNLSAHTWDSIPLPGMPFQSGLTGQSKKSKDGGSAAWYNNAIYALKGGNTCEFWKYIVATATWIELETMPSFGSTGRTRRVKAGGDIVSFGNGAFYALKGNKTLEFWRYGTGMAFAGYTPSREGVMAKQISAGRISVTITPNPLAGRFVAISSSSGPVKIMVYDPTGRSVLSKTLLAGLPAQAGILDLRNLSAGVYLVKLSTDGSTTTRKLVLR